MVWRHGGSSQATNNQGARERQGINPIGSMYGIFTYIYHKFEPNVGEYTIHGSYGNRYLRKIRCTPPEFNMEPEDHGFQKDFPLKGDIPT